MAGVYFHIPFCKQACHYCNFHFRVGLKDDEAMLEAMLEELKRESKFPFKAPLDSVYFGGGTPSLFSAQRIERFLNACERSFGIAAEAEITLEANPDDLDRSSMEAYRAIGITRLSIGVQSFDDGLLRIFNRAHGAEEAERCLRRVNSLGFKSASADLIFGMPGYGLETLERDLEQLIELEVPHISPYGLTVEPRTVLAHRIEKGELSPPDEAETSKAYERIMERLQEAGYEHYEISNFALPGHRARHNSAYWTGEPYLGIGPSAHSFDGASRWWNVAANARYIRGIREDDPEREREDYDPVDRANERMLTRIRTEEGLHIEELRPFGIDLWELQGPEIRSMIEEGSLKWEEERVRLTRKGKLFADRVAERLFILKDDR
ncbi:MAG: radical SAM family heme chaperone HemW [Flavobacteriales bacterium]